jgi:hypothetical protein
VLGQWGAGILHTPQPSASRHPSSRSRLIPFCRHTPKLLRSQVFLGGCRNVILKASLCQQQFPATRPILETHTLTLSSSRGRDRTLMSLAMGRGKSVVRSINPAFDRDVGRLRSRVGRGGPLSREETGVVVRALAALEHEACLRRLKKPLPELFVPDLLCERSQGPADAAGASAWCHAPATLRW